MNFFENTSLHDTSVKLFNTKIHEWIGFMPIIQQSLGNICMFPEFSMKVLNKCIKTNTNSNKHVYLMSILSIFRHKREMLIDSPIEDIDILREKWLKIFSENEQPIIDRRLENKPTDKQNEKGGSKIDFNQIITKRDELPIGSIERLLISMYTMIPPARADYFATQIVTDETPTEKNYIRMGDKVECVLTDFKTVKTYKSITHDFPDCLITELNESLKKIPRKYLFLNANGKPHTRNSFVLWSRRCLSRIFETDFTLVFFRHAFVTHYISTMDTNTITDGQIKEMSDKLGHSPEMFRAYKWIKGQE